MKNVRCNGNIDIHKWQRLPERIEYWLYSISFTGGMESAYVAISQSISVKCFSIVMRFELLVFPKLVMRDVALGTLAIVCASH